MVCTCGCKKVTSLITNLFKVPPPKKRLPKEKIDKVYTFTRYRVFVSIFVGYMGYYFIRNSTGVLSGILKMSATEIGLISCAGFFSYGISKFVSGLMSDRSNSKVFLAIGLFLSGLVNLLIGVIPSVVTSVFLFTIMYLINGWIQGMGYPPGIRTLMYWYGDKERITWATLWNLSHNVGAALAPVLIGLSFAVAGDSALAQVRAGFYVPGLVCMAMSIALYFIQVDTPESIGLPPIEEWRHETENQAPVDEKTEKLSISAVVRQYILPNRKLLYCCIHGSFVYILRYGIVVWAPKFLSSSPAIGGKGLGKLMSMGGFSVFEIGGMIGMLLAGYLSIRIFRNSKPVTNVFFLFVSIALLVIYWLIPPGSQYQTVNYLILVCLGLSIYGPVMFIGLYSAELVPKNVAGTASGLTGTFSYLFGAIVATLGMGTIVDTCGWGATFGVLIFAALAAIVLTLLSRETSLEFKWSERK